MRTVALLAAILALPCGLFADDSQVPAIDLTIAPPATCTSDTPPAGATASGKYDTSVYHLKHAHARQIIPAVRQALCKSFAAEAAGHAGCCSVVSVVFMPTSSDDTLVAICPREQADVVKQAIESCDVEKQYAVKLQLFEISPTGEAVAVGDPAVVVGREGIVQCKTSANGPVTLKLQVSDAPPGVTVPANEAASTETPDEPYCCGPDCGQSATEAEAEVGPPPLTPAETSVCPTSCTGQPACAATCPTLARACPVTSSAKCSTCNGTCHAGHGECGAVCTSESPACKAKCAGTCKCESTGACNCDSAESCSSELSDPCEKSPATSSLTQSLTPEENQVLIRILLQNWMLEHQEHSGIGRAVVDPAKTGESCPNCDSSATKESPAASSTSAETPADKTGVELGSPASAPGPSEVPATTQTTTPYDPSPAPSLVGNAETGGLFVRPAHTNDDGFHLSGVCRLGPCDQDDVAVTRVSDSDSCGSSACPNSSDGPSSQNTCAGECPGSGTEPPALLTLSARKDAGPSFNIVVSPRWQAELAKIYQGRRLSEIFDAGNCQDPSAAALGRLLVEIPKPACDAEGVNAPHHGVIVVDMPDRIRVFESAAGTGPATAASCSNCRDQFRAFLEEIFRGPSGLEEITQAGHLQVNLDAVEAGRELPSVTQSKLDTTVVTYPLRDLVLLDNADRPVFDTCTIIDHIQSAVAPETWGHPSVSIQLDQQTMSLVIRQTPEVHKKIEAHLRELRRQQIKQLSSLIERLSTESEQSDD
jgi:hypothetical protein